MSKEMNIEEAIKNCKKYIELVEDKNYCDCNELNVISTGNYCDGSKNVAQAIETILSELEKKDMLIKMAVQVIENSISKNKIRDKITERQFELQQEYKDFKGDARLETLQELYYEGDE